MSNVSPIQEPKTHALAPWQEAGGGANILLPKKGTTEAANLPLLQGRLPEKCEFPKAGGSAGAD